MNTYGIPMYKEINPAVFAMVTFPFLFGVMYGDMGHGGIYLILAILLVMFDDKIRRIPDIGKTVSSLRYILLLMGIFAVFNGFIYNEFFAMPQDLFGSCYERDPRVLAGTVNPNGTLTGFSSYGFPRTSDKCVYSFGMDPRWF